MFEKSLYSNVTASALILKMCSVLISCIFYRDIPDQLPVWVGETETQKGCTIYQVGDNIFAAVK